MFILALGVGLSVVLLAKVEFRRVSDSAALGTMSQHWVVAYNASQPASSQ